MLTMIHSNPAVLESGLLRIDRKFHTGMLAFVDALACPITTVHPRAADVSRIMDPVILRLNELPYAVRVRERQGDSSVADLISKSTLVCGGDQTDWRIAIANGIPFIPVLEYDLGTQIVVASPAGTAWLKKAVRSARVLGRYLSSQSLLSSALEIHCNGYPIYRALRSVDSPRLLYLDSRMTQDMVIPASDLEARLAARSELLQPLKLLYSGRYEPMKGAIDAVLTALKCADLGANVELHCFGQGSQKAEMERLGARLPLRIFINDAIPFPELVAVSRRFDMFLCCHVQSDPSCTYLESMGAGLAVAGYKNRMWHGLQSASGAGVIAPIGDYHRLASEIMAVAKDHQRLVEYSRKARAFALKHTFELEFRRRTEAISAAMRRMGE
jgi:glycosyltransferase involved in cell wall biosynthesis